MATQAATSQKLAIDGGPKAVTNKLIGWPNFDEKAIHAVEAVLRSGKINYWTGLERHVLRNLINELLLRVEALGLKVEPDQKGERLTGLSIFVTTLTMNYVYTNQFVKS